MIMVRGSVVVRGGSDGEGLRVSMWDDEPSLFDLASPAEDEDVNEPAGLPAEVDSVDGSGVVVPVEVHEAVVVTPVAARTVMERHERNFTEPVRRLNATLNDVLDVDTHPERRPEEAMGMLREAMEQFQAETVTWLD